MLLNHEFVSFKNNKYYFIKNKNGLESDEGHGNGTIFDVVHDELISNVNTNIWLSKYVIRFMKRKHI